MAGARLDPMKCGVSFSDTRTIWMGAPGRHSLYTIDVPHVDTTVEAEAVQDDLIGSRPRCCREDGRNFPCELGVGGIEGMAALVTRCGFCRPPPLDYCAPDGGLCQLFDDFKGDADAWAGFAPLLLRDGGALTGLRICDVVRRVRPSD
jgi:hypothetical protein